MWHFKQSCRVFTGIVVNLCLASSLRADVCNLKVVTDANPDYSDIGSLIYSATSNWPETRDKVWAMFYWNNIARRATSPMQVHGLELTDPMMQFNDYGYAMCSTSSGINCGIWGAMGLPVKFWDVACHTVSEVEYDGKYHLLDNDFTGLYTLCDGKTLASVDEVGQEGACAASNGKVEAGHIAKYHCLTATSPNGCQTGGDGKTIPYLADRFDPRYLKFRYYYNNWDLGHRWILNLRGNECYTRYYHRLDADSTNAVVQSKSNPKYKADPAYFTPNPLLGGADPESTCPGDHIRGNGIRTYAPDLSAAALARNVWSMEGVTAIATGVTPATAGKPGIVVFRVEGANVITSLKIHTQFAIKTTADHATIAISTDNGMTWKDVYAAEQSGVQQSDLKLIREVNGTYDVLVRISLLGQSAPADAALQAVQFETITQLNSKTQPRLHVGKNTVYVGTGAPSQSVVLWPDLRGDDWKRLVVDSRNVATCTNHPGYLAVMYAEKPNDDAYVVFKFDLPGNATRLTYGGRFCLRPATAFVSLLHSFDNGKTWTNSYTLVDNSMPWDVIHYTTVNDVPAGIRRVLVKYLWRTPSLEKTSCGLYAMRMEVNYSPAETTFRPLDVAFTWKEVQDDCSLVERSHVQRVDKVPVTYTINVGGADHPVMESLRISSVNPANNGSARYGYSDGKDVGGVKHVDRWMNVGKILSVGKPYTTTEKSLSTWGAGDPDGKKLTDNIVGPSMPGGIAPSYGVLYDTKMKPEITVDLGESQKCGAFRIAVNNGYPGFNVFKCECKDKVEILTSTDGQAFVSRGWINFNLRYKDVPVNFFFPDDETLYGYNAPLTVEPPVDARYVKFRITPGRGVSISEVQVLDHLTYTPFDLRLALPDGKDHTDLSAYNPPHTPCKEYKRCLKTMGPDGAKMGTLLQ